MLVSRRLVLGAALVAPLAAYPVLVGNPVLGIGVAILAVGVYIAARSPSYPVALWALPGIVIGLLGSDPFPNKSIAFFLTGWVALGLAFAVLHDTKALPFRAMASPPVLLSIGLAVLMVTRLGSSPALPYGAFKLQLFLAQNLVLLVAGIVIARRTVDFERYIGLLLAVSFLGALVVMHGLVTHAAQFQSVGGRFSLFQGETPITLGREAAQGILVGAYVLLVAGALWRRTLALAALPALGVTFVASGSRGPVLGLIVGLIVFSALTLKEPGARKRLLFLAGGAVVAALLVPSFVPGQTLGRTFGVLFGDTNAGKGDVSNGRFGLWSEAWHQFTAHPLLGIGTGGFAGNEPEALYPHNIFLESASELGIFGLLLVLAIVGYTGLMLVRLWRRGAVVDRVQLAFVAASFVAAVVNANFSGDVNFNSEVWLMSGLAIGLSRRVLPETGSEPRGWAQRLRRKAEPEEEPRRPAELGPQRGSIVEPADGSTVAGVVAVSAVPAQTGWTISGVAIEVAAAHGEWVELMPEPTEEAYEIALVSRGAGQRRRRVTVVHSRERAEQLKALLDAEHEGGPERVEIASLQSPRGEAVAWDTAAVADGTYRLRAVTTDIAGHTVESPEALVEVANEPAPEHESLVLEARLDAVGGTVELRARPDREYEVEWVAFQASSAGRSDWQTLAQVEEAPFVALVDATRLADGVYDFRALSGRTDGRVDCSRPVRLREVEVVAQPAPVPAPALASWLLQPAAGSVVSRTVALGAAAEGPQPFEVAFECSLDGREWFELGAVVAPPYTCYWDTTAAPNGDYWLRAAVYDAAGHGAAGAPIQVRVANETPVRALTYREAMARLAAADPVRSEPLRAWLRDYVGPEGTIPEEFSGRVSDGLRDLGV